MTQTATPSGAASRVGGPAALLSAEEVTSFVREQLGGADLDGRSMRVLVPDGTRSCPLPFLLGAVHGAAYGRVSRLTVLVALGTHVPMTEGSLATHLGYPEGGLDGRYPGTTVQNHAWGDPETFVTLATGIGRELVERVALGYLDPAGVDSARRAEDPATMIVPNAGEGLFRLRRARA